MDQIKALIRTLSVRQRWSLVIAAILVATGVYGLARWQRETGFRPLYGPLAAEDASSVVQKLKEEGVPYRLSADGTLITVPQDRIPELRLEMAGAGLPKSGRIGFEIFDKTNFGMSDFAERINYQRALEGELERSVMALSQVEQARVHISFPQESVFTEARQPAKASVLVRLRTGAQLPSSAVSAITHLISSAVENLAAEAVSVMDMRGALLNRPRRGGEHSQEISEAALEYQRKVEQNLVAKLNSTLEPVVGAGRFRTAVSAECDMTSGEQSEESFDPTRSVMVTSQKTEDVSGGVRVAGGMPGTASNLPDPAPRPTPAGEGGVSRRTENVSYQSSRTVKRTVLPQGPIRKLSVSVLLDHEVHREGTGAEGKRVLAPPSPQRMKVIHDLAAAAIGLNAERGDQLIVESLAFETSLNTEPPESLTEQQKVFPPPASPPWLVTLIETLRKNPRSGVAGGLAAGVLALFCVALLWGMRKRQRKGAPGKTVDSLPPAPEFRGAVLGESQPGDLHLPVPPQAARAAPVEPREEDLVDTVRAMALKDAEISVRVLREWLQEEQS